MKERLGGSSMVRQEFLQKWMKGLQTYSKLSASASVWDRKKAIKLSADIAIASTTNSSSSRWSQALMADIASRDDDDGTNRILIEGMLGQKIGDRDDDQKKPSSNGLMMKCSKKILRRSHVSIARRRRRRRKGGVMGRAEMVEKRTRVLKRLVPGGEELNDDISLIREALDYISSLRTQRDVMKRVAERFGPFKFI